MKRHSILKIYLGLCFGVLSFHMHSQNVLSLNEAVQIALENNFEIRLASNNLEIDSLSVSPGFAGILPRISASLNTNNSTQYSSQVRADGTEIELDGAKNINKSYGVGLDWTLFDGFSMFARYDQLKELQKFGEAELKFTILNRASDVMITYYDLVQQQQQLTALDSTIVISKQRIDLANNRFGIGKASKLEVLNAEVDLNTDRTLYLRMQELHASTKIRLNEILGRDPKIDFAVEDDILLNDKLVLTDLEALAVDQNPALQAQLINKRIAELELKRIKGSRYPTITATTGYNFSDSESTLGFARLNNSRGWNYGFSASIDIFNGFNQNRNEKIAKIQLENSTLAIEQQSLTIKSQLNAAFQTYLTNIGLIGLETSNEEIAKENLDITLAKYNTGTIPTIEFRTAQLNYINAQLRLSEAKYQAKLSEITLKQLAGNLSLN